jgi:site-specific DNA recombinase
MSVGSDKETVKMSTVRRSTGTDNQRRAAIYCRVSTAKQEDEGTSLESQEHACRAHAEALGYQLGPVFREVHSGADLFGRDQMTALRETVRHREVGIVIAYALDRLARKQVHQGLIYSEAEHAGVPIEFVTERLEDTPEGRLLLSVKSYAAEIEREKIAERTVRGKRTRVQSGKLHNHAAELYGYRRDKEAGKREIVDREAAIVRRIFRATAVEGQAVRGLVRQLNAEGVPPPSQGKRMYRDGRVTRWNPSVIYRILAEPAYKGDTVVWRLQTRGKNASCQQRDPSEWITLPAGTTPPIVTPETWQAAQERVTTGTATTTRNAARPYLLRGLIFCAVCGQRLYAESEHGRPVYRCSSRDKPGGACGGKRVPGEAVEAWAWAEVSTILRTPAIIAAEVERQREAGPDQALQADREAAARMLAKVERQRDRLVRRYAEADDDGFPWELVEREIARLEDERRQAVATVAEIDARLERHEAATMQLDALHDYCAAVAVNIEHADFTIKRNAVEALVERISANGLEWTVQGSIPVGQHVGVSSTTLARYVRQRRRPPGRA